ncbi:hypothetical protein Tco_0820070 [Tanacetum coccineum]|uniref:Transposase (Putative), gypsy type n=1 Tax=Tanacetum coccineum TaxID=301880 RepID=A0ABQ5A982_9ASTR
MDRTIILWRDSKYSCCQRWSEWDPFWERVRRNCDCGYGTLSRWSPVGHRCDEMDLFALINVADPTNVKIVERERVEGEPKLLESTGDSTAGGGHDAKIEFLTTAEDTAAVTAERAKRPRKKRSAVADANGSSHPPKKLKGDYGTFGGVATGGKSLSVIKELLARTRLNVEASVEAVATLPFVTSSVSAMPKCEVDNLTDSVNRANLCTIDPPKRFVISSDSPHYSSTNASEAEVDSIIRSTIPPPLVMTEAVITSVTANAYSIPIPEMRAHINAHVYASMFNDSDYAGIVRPAVAGSSYIPQKDLSIGSREVDFETLHKTFGPHWNVSNDTLLDDHDAALDFIDYLAPPAFRGRWPPCSEVSAVEAAKRVHVDELNVLKQRNMALEDEKNSLDGKIIELQSSISAKDLKLKDLNVVVSFLKSQNDSLMDQVLLGLKASRCCLDLLLLRLKFHTKEKCSRLDMEHIDTAGFKSLILPEMEKGYLSGVGVSPTYVVVDSVNRPHPNDYVYSNVKESHKYRSRRGSCDKQDAQLKVVNDKVAKLDADLVEMACHLEENYYPYLLTTISGRRWLLTYGLKLVFIKCLNSSEYLMALEAAISHAIEQGMQSGLTARIDHGKEGRNLADVVAYNPAAEANFNSVLQKLHEEGPLADAPGMSDLQPNVEQLKIKANIMAEQSGLLGVWTPLSEPLFPQNLTGADRTSDSVPAAIATTTALSTTFASASSIPPITVYDYKIVHADGQDSS